MLLRIFDFQQVIDFSGREAFPFKSEVLKWPK